MKSFALILVFSGICLASTVGDELIKNVKIMRPKTFEIFLKNNPNIDLNYQNEDGETALMVAMFNNKQGNVKTLLEKETLKLDLTNGADGSNALHFGCSDPNGNFDAVELFLKHLANSNETRTFDVDALNSKGKTAWELCSEKLTKKRIDFEKLFDVARKRPKSDSVVHENGDDYQRINPEEVSQEIETINVSQGTAHKTPSAPVTENESNGNIPKEVPPGTETKPDKDNASGVRASFIMWFLSFLFLLFLLKN